MEASQTPQNEEQQARQMLEALIGKQEPGSAPPAEAQHDQQQPDEKFVPKSRFDEALQRARVAQEQNERLMRELLAQRPQNSAPSHPAYDPDVYEQVSPILSAEMAKLREEIQGSLRPVIEHVNRQVGMDVLRRDLKGFDDLADEIRQRFEAMPPEQRAQYDNVLGAKAIAGEILAERMASGRQRESTSSLAARAHTASGGSSAPASNNDPWSLSSGAFERVLEGIRRQG